jgi:hypothetical protein
VNRRWAHSITSAPVAMAIDNNGTWSDAFQFGDPDDMTWTLDGCAFEMDVQLSRYDETPKLSMSTDNGRIVILDPVQRVICFNVAPDDIQTSLTPGIYVYDLVMVEGAITSSSATRVPLMHGTVEVAQGVTYPPGI